MKRVVATMGVLALGISGVASAANHPSREESIGMLSGVAVGAAAGGPVGAFVGIVAGAVLGDRYHRQKQTVEALGERLSVADRTQAALSAELRTSQAQIAALSEQLRSQPLPPSVQRTLRGEIMFRTNDATVDADTAARLADLAQLLTTAPGIVVKLDAYADPRGTERDNLVLSEKRAQSVREALLAGGIAEERIIVVSHGEQGAASPEGDVDGYALDRRVVITIGSAGSQVAQSLDAP